MNLNRLVNDIVDSLWNNSLKEIIKDGITIDYSKKSSSISNFLDEILFGDQINFYPGTKRGKCCETAVFLSVTKAPPRAKWMKKSEMISLEKMFPKVVQHMQGKCYEKTKRMALIVDDNLSMKTVDEWKSNLRHIQSIDQKEVMIVYVDSEGKTHHFNIHCGLSPF